jgi:plastocyanin
MAKKTKPKARRGVLRGNATLAVGALALLGVVLAAVWLAFDGGGVPKRKLLRQTPVVSTEMQVSVDVIDKDFAPRVLTVNKGATVTWKFLGDLPHNVTDDRGAFASKTLQKGGEYSRTFDQPGIFYYFCTVHHAMLGTLTVTE